MRSLAPARHLLFVVSWQGLELGEPSVVVPSTYAPQFLQLRQDQRSQSASGSYGELHTIESNNSGIIISRLYDVFDLLS